MNESAKLQELEREISAVVKLGRRPVAVAYLDAEPTGIRKFEGSEPSGCSFWRLAAEEGSTFYTIPENHFNCAVGAYTHNMYTGLGEDELYVVVRGTDLAKVAAALKTIDRANVVLQEYAKERREQLSTL
jgi:uncharacterized protein (DUF169 family)